MIVYTFILVTCGLLIWATIKPYAETYLEVRALLDPTIFDADSGQKFRNRHSYNPVAQNGN